MGALDGKVAIVTGGTGGLGAAVVAALLHAGAAVFVPHRTAGDLDGLRGSLGLDANAPISGDVLDLADEAAVAQAYTSAAEQLGGIDILVNVAGGFGGGKRSISPELLAILADPGDKGPVELLTDAGGSEWLVNRRNGFRYPVEDGIPIMLLEEGEKNRDEGLING
ncbi:hypothetical protein SE17_18775 [Kouleothrix aurantiaca]|uniref:Short-chain dehydrogenase n=1 Tax=Kouleothrix aurantiaca TaxID=186479 RepID=A0A0P9CZB7_9CHLR|nr:hypothetical protein SE17_18775 [Kouleothrix aurantiaca]